MNNENSAYTLKNRLNREPRNVMKLREIEASGRLAGQENGRRLPPPPVLPPSETLEKISGTLESISSEFYREYFGVQLYRNNTLPSVSESQRNIGAVLATVAGNPTTGILLASDKVTQSEMNRAEYVQGMINGQPFRGWVGLTRLQSGDDVDMVVDWQGDHYEVYAIAKPAERVVSICPGCVRGRTAEAWLRLKSMLTIMIYLVLVFSAIFLTHADGAFSERFRLVFLSDGYTGIWCLAIIVFSLFTAVMAISAYNANASTTCKLAEEIFSVLGLPDAEKVNMDALTKKREKELKRKGLWYSPKDKTKPPCPRSVLMPGFESWYYY